MTKRIEEWVKTYSAPTLEDYFHTNAVVKQLVARIQPKGVTGILLKI